MLGLRGLGRRRTQRAPAGQAWAAKPLGGVGQVAHRAGALYQPHSNVKDQFLRITWMKATKGVRWMPWRQAPMKDVEHCDKPRGAVCRRYIRGCPNGETPGWLARVRPDLQMNP
jgi:hypothetical protein